MHVGPTMQCIIGNYGRCNFTLMNFEVYWPIKLTINYHRNIWQCITVWLCINYSSVHTKYPERSHLFI